MARALGHLYRFHPTERDPRSSEVVRTKPSSSWPLRQQLAVYVHKHPRPRLSPLDRAFWVALSKVWPRWRTALVVVRPETVIRWHRKAFRGYWRWISKPGPGRPPISQEIKALIVRMATENGWRARKIREELSKLGIHLGKSTISRYLPKLAPGPDPAATMDDLPQEPPGRDRRDGFLRRADRSFPLAVRLVSRSTMGGAASSIST